MRIVVPNLLPGQLYNLQFRSKNDTETSAWSRTWQIQAAVDTIAPKTPTGLVVKASGDSFVSNWDAVTENEDGSPALDLSHYLVKIRNLANNDTTVQKVFTNEFELTFNLNIALFDPLAASIAVSVASVDAVGNVSAYTDEVTATNPAPGPVRNLVANGVIEGIDITWEPPANLEDDFKEYQVFIGNTEDFDIDDTNMVWRGISTSHLYQTTTITPLYVKVVAVDKFNSRSTVSTAGPVTPRSVVGADTDAPDTPTDLAGTITGTTMNVTWTAPANPDNDLAGYTIQYRKVGETTWSSQNATHEDTSAAIPVEFQKDYQIRISAHDFSFNRSNWSTIVNVAGEVNTAPATPTGLQIRGAINSAMVVWNKNTESDLKEYEVQFEKHTPTEADEIYTTAGSNMSFVENVTTNTTYYARIRSVDTGGLKSAWSSVVSGTVGFVDIPEVELSDGNPPANSPVATATGGFGSIFLQWPAVSNNDKVTYEIHLGTTSGFTPAAGTKVGESDSTFTTIHKGPSATDLAYGQDYYVKLVAKDVDGAAAPGAASNVVQVKKVDRPDIDKLTDGVAPASSPAATALGGFGTIFVNWNPVSNADPVTYEVHLSTTSGFTPASGTKVGETTSTFTNISKTGAGAALAYGTNYYVRIIAKDADGAAPAGTQSAATQIKKVGLSDTTNVKTDGAAPASSPVATLTGSIKSLHARWTPVANNDPVTYEVHLGTTTGFTPGAGTLVGQTTANFTSIAKLADGTTDLDYDTDYYVKIVAKDADGAAAASGASNAARIQWVPSAVDFGQVNERLDNTIKDSVVEYAVNSSETTAPTSGWSTTQPTRTPGTFVWFRTVVTYGDNTTNTSSPALLTGNTGAKGDTGTGIASTEVTYQAHTSGTAAPTGTWLPNPPATSPGQYLWTRTVTTFTDGTTVPSYAVAKHGETGTAGRGITGTVVDYAKNTSPTSEPTTGWSTSIPATTTGEYLWTRTVTSYTSGSPTTAYSVAAHGTPGADGVGVSGSTVEYAKSSNGTTAPTTGWSGTIPATVAGEFLWTRTTINYTNGTSTTAHTVAAHGAKGDDGVGVSGTAVTYAKSSSGTTIPTSGWGSTIPTTSPGEYLWTRTITTYTDGSTTPAYSVARHGATGTAGVSITSVTPFYQQTLAAASAPAKPSGTTPPAPWTATEPDYVEGTALWRTERITYSSGSPSYTDVTKVSSYEAAAAARAIAITADLRVRSGTYAPGNPEKVGAPEGAIWHEYGAASAPNSGTVLKETWRLEGGNWVRRGTVDRTLVPLIDIGDGTFGSLTGGRLVANSVGADQINVNSLVGNTAWLNTLVTSQAFIDNAKIKTANIEGTLTIGKIDGLQTELDTLNTDIEGVEGRALSRGTNLVTNGTGYLGTNYNFTTFSGAGTPTFDASDAPPGANGSFKTPATISGTLQTDELIPIDSTVDYQHTFWIRQQDVSENSRFYAMIIPYDAFGNAITTTYYMWVPGTTTQLAQPLNPGDTVVHLNSVANYYGQAGKPAGSSGHLRRLTFWDYVDPGGKLWPRETYSRNQMASNSWADGAVNPSNNTITLSAPYSGPAKPAGTWVSNGSAGSNYPYMPGTANALVPKEWTRYSATFKGGTLSQTSPQGSSPSYSGGWPPGTAQIKLAWFINYGGTGANSTVAVAGVSLSDAVAAQTVAAETKTLTDGWRYSGTTKIHGGEIQTDTIKAGSIDVQDLVGSTAFLQHLQVNTANIVNGAITTAKIGDAQITGSLVVDNAITANKINVASLIADTAWLNTLVTSQAFIDRAKFKFANVTDTLVIGGSNTSFAPGYDPTKIATGGRNLLRDSGRTITNGAYNIAQYTLTDTLALDEEVTLTLRGSLSAGRTHFMAYNSGGSVQLISPITHIGNGVYRATFKWKIGSANNTSLWIYASPNNGSGNSTIEWIKLERGNLGTDWTPAPEDNPALAWVHPGTTKISGGMIETDTIKADSIDTDSLLADTAFITDLVSTQAFITNLEVTTANITDLTFDKIEGGQGIITSLDIKNTLTVATGGIIQSANYSSSAGYRLTNNELIINNGTIKAAALQTQVGQNLVPGPYAGFEMSAPYYDSMAKSGCTGTIMTTGGKFGKQFLRLQSTTSGTSSIYLGTGITDYNISVEPGQQYIVSAYFKGTGAGVSTNAFIFVRGDDGTNIASASRTVGISDDWERVSAVVTIPSNITSVIIFVYTPTASTSASVDVDGVQFELKTSSSNEPSAWMPGSNMTHIDGNIIRTGEIRSNVLNHLSQPQWSLNKDGGMQIGSALIRGTVTVGNTTGEASWMQSAQYTPGSAGWRINASGYAEFQNITIGANQIGKDSFIPGTLSVGNLTGGNINATIGISSEGKITAGSATQFSQLDNTGFKFWNIDVEDGGTTEAPMVALGPGDNFLNILVPDPDTTLPDAPPVSVGFGADGTMSALNAYVARDAVFDGAVHFNQGDLPGYLEGSYGPFINGKHLIDRQLTNHFETHPGLGEQNAWTLGLAYGIVGRWRRPFGSAGFPTPNSSSYRRELVRATFEAQHNRVYRVQLSAGPLARNGGSSTRLDWGKIRLRSSSTDGSGVAWDTGTLVTDADLYLSGGEGEWISPQGYVYLIGGQDIPAGTVNLLTYIELFAQVGITWGSSAFLDIVVEDVGRWSSNFVGGNPSGIHHGGQSGGGSGGGTIPKEYTKTYTSNATAVFAGTTRVTNSTYHKNRLRSGRGGSSTYNSYAYFDDAQIRSDIGSGTITKVEIYLYYQGNYPTGDAYVGLHNGSSPGSSPPSRYAATTGADGAGSRWRFRMGKGRWITIHNANLSYNNWKTGTYRGIYVGLPSASSDTIMDFHSHYSGNKPKIRITYRR